VNEGGEHDIEFIEAGEDAAIALERAEEAFDFIAPALQSLGHIPKGKAAGDGVVPRA